MRSARLSWTQKIGYGSGDFAFNLYRQGVSPYLFYFYTDVLGLPMPWLTIYGGVFVGCRN